MTEQLDLKPRIVQVSIRKYAGVGILTLWRSQRLRRSVGIHVNAYICSPWDFLSTIFGIYKWDYTPEPESCADYTIEVGVREMYIRAFGLTLFGVNLFIQYQRSPKVGIIGDDPNYRRSMQRVSPHGWYPKWEPLNKQGEGA